MTTLTTLARFAIAPLALVTALGATAQTQTVR